MAQTLLADLRTQVGVLVQIKSITETRPRSRAFPAPEGLLPNCIVCVYGMNEIPEGGTDGPMKNTGVFSSVGQTEKGVSVLL